MSFASRIQLINSRLFVITNLWMQCMPIYKHVIKKVKPICKSFLWSGREIITRKSPIAWHRICTPKYQGGLNIISLKEWNKANMCKLLWSLCGKAYSLYIMTVLIRKSFSWILKAILKVRQDMHQSQIWCFIPQQPKFQTRIMYISMKEEHLVVQWRKILYENVARPKVNHVLWMGCHERLDTKDMMNRFGLLDNATYCFCREEKLYNILCFPEQLREKYGNMF